MKQRCNYRGNPNYPRYGGRGIGYDPRWELYRNFLEDMGERPYGTTLDRKDSNGDYSKDNCRWATHKQQGENKNNATLITAFGMTHTISAWSRITGIPEKRIRDRFHHGWGGEQCFETHQRGRFGRAPNGEKLQAPLVGQE